MRIFLTGATGFIGSALVPELIHAGHQVVGLTRSDAGAEALRAAGAEVHLGDLGDGSGFDAVSRGIARADAVIHTAFNHDFANFLANCEADRRAIAAIGAELAGSGRPLVVTSAIAVVKAQPGRPAHEDDAAASASVSPRAASEEAAAAVAARGVPVSVVRLAQVHDRLKQGLVSALVQLARDTGVSAFAGSGAQRWPAVPVADVVRLYRLALESLASGAPGAVHHAVAEEGVALCDIAAVIGRGLNVPVVSLAADQVASHFGWLTKFAGLDMPATSARTRHTLGWSPVGPGLLSDLEQMRY